MTRAFTAERRQLTALRLAAQRISSTTFTTPAEVVRHMLAMQAQDFPGAKWSVGLRATGVTDADVETAIAERAIVRSWPMRGTLHLAPAEDLAWMLSLTRDRMVRGAAGRHRQLELDDASFTTAADIADGLLTGNRIVGRTALLAAFDAAGLSTAGQRGNHLLWYLSVTGRLVFGPLDGKQHSFVLLEEWVPKPRQLDRDEALGEFARRYFTSHGPATDRDFAWWSSLSLTEARTGLSIAKKDLDELQLDGTTYYLAPGLEPASSAVHALPGFDEYVLGYQDRSAQLAPSMATRIVPGGNGMFLSTIVVDGEILGTWKRTSTAKRIAIEVVPFEAISKKALAGFAAEARRYGVFAGREIAL